MLISKYCICSIESVKWLFYYNNLLRALIRNFWRIHQTLEMLGCGYGILCLGLTEGESVALQRGTVHTFCYGIWEILRIENWVQLDPCIVPPSLRTHECL
jgi:hypothetical protein